MKANLSRILVLGASLMTLSFALEGLATDIDDDEQFPPPIGSPLPKCEEVGIFVTGITGPRLLILANPNSPNFKAKLVCSINTRFITCNPRATTFILIKGVLEPNPDACTGPDALQALPSAAMGGADPWYCTTNPLTGKTSCVCQDKDKIKPGCQ